jgi:hypothetical protein
LFGWLGVGHVLVMQNRTKLFRLGLFLVVLFALGSAVGCTEAHAIPEPDLHLVLGPTGTQPLRPVVTLDSCLAGTGTLRELGAVNNDDQHDHGALLTFGISPGGLVAAAGADGTLKFWTLDATLVGVADPGVLTYGPEIGGAPITDLAFTDALAIAGDVRGLVQQLGPDGSGGVVGGTMPDVPIASVAFDRTAQRLAHAQGGAGAPDVTPLVVYTLDGSMRANIEAPDVMATIVDLGFTVDGELVVGGDDGTHAVLEIRDGADPTVVRARPDVGRDASVVEVATAREGAAIVVATTRSLFRVDGETATLLARSDVDLRSVDLTPSGDFVLTVDANGDVVARSTVDGHEAGHASIGGAIGVRVDATGQRIVVGAQDAMLHVLACE